MNTQKTASIEIRFDLGTFEGFNFRDQCAIMKRLTAADVVTWDHDGEGEAEFWPSGDRREVSLIFGGREVVAQELLDLDRLLTELGDDSKESCLRIYYAVRCAGSKLEDLTTEGLQDYDLNFFFGSNFTDIREEAAYQLFELYYPEQYAAWEKSTCDGLVFDVDRFLDSPAWFTEEITLDGEKVLIVGPN